MLLVPNWYLEGKWTYPTHLQNSWVWGEIISEKINRSFHGCCSSIEENSDGSSSCGKQVMVPGSSGPLAKSHYKVKKFLFLKIDTPGQIATSEGYSLLSVYNTKV